MTIQWVEGWHPCFFRQRVLFQTSYPNSDLSCPYVFIASALLYLADPFNQSIDLRVSSQCWQLCNPHQNIVSHNYNFGLDFSYMVMDFWLGMPCLHIKSTKNPITISCKVLEGENFGKFSDLQEIYQHYLVQNFPS